MAEADDTAAWDVSLLPLFGSRGDQAGGASGAGGGGTEMAVGAAGVVGASAYTIARNAGADAGTGQEFAEPARPAWRPKPSSGGDVPSRTGFTCSGAEPDKRPTAADSSDSDAEQGDSGRPRGRTKKPKEDGESSVADLLRQSGDIWGGGGFQ